MMIATPADLQAIRAALLPLGRSDPFARFSAIVADMDRDYTERRRRWERDGPKREKAEAAYRRAAERRAAELGRRPMPPRVMASMLGGEPQRPQVWL
jgi:hypothetical protein